MKKYLVIYEEGLVIRDWNPEYLKKEQFVCTKQQAKVLRNKMTRNFPSLDYRITPYKKKLFDSLIPLFEWK